MPALVAVAVVLGEVIVALSIADPRFSRVLVLVAGAVALTLVFRFPFAAACVLMALFGSVQLSFLVAPLGPVDARAYELLLGALLLVAVVRPVRATWGGGAGAALAIFLGLVIVAAVTAISVGAVTPVEALPWARPFCLYAFFFVVVRLFPRRHQVLRLLSVGAVFGALSGVVAALIATKSGLGAALDFGAGFNTGKGEDTIGGGADRVQLPGLGLAYILFWFALYQLVKARGAGRVGWSLVLGGMALNILVSQTRNMWLGLFIGLLLLLVLSGSGLRHRLVVGATVLVLGLVLMLSFGAGLRDDPRFGPIAERGSTLVDPDAVGQERSLSDRGAETELALEAVRANLVTGIGPGADFGMSFGLRREDGTQRPATQRFLHNQYVYLLLIGGVPTLLAFLAFLGLSLRVATRNLDRDPVQVVLAVGLFTMMVSAVVWIVFASYEMIGAIALVTGAMAALAVSERESAAGAVP